MRKLSFLFVAIILSSTISAQELSGSYLFAQRDTCDLYLDVYHPAPGSQTQLDGVTKPTILFVFGGGFITGSRNDPFYDPWFKLLTDDGYGVVSIDYRLGLKGIPMRFDLFHLVRSAKHTKRAVDSGVEDVFEAIRFISDNSAKLGIDPGNIVIAGSSAGAMISLSSMLETCSPTERTAILPEGFRFKGLMSFAGGVMSSTGVPEYQSEPAPQLLLHGTADGAVAYDKIAFGRLGLYGSSSLVEKVFSKKGYVYEIYRYIGHNHDIAAHFVATWPVQRKFLELNVIKGMRRTIDATLDDPTVPKWESVDLGQIYK